MAVIIDSYSESNFDGTYAAQSGNQNTYVGQAFKATNDYRLTSAKFYLKKVGTPTGNAVAKIYAATGTYGSNAKPTGSPLATSDNFDISTLTTSFALAQFTFSGSNQITLVNGNVYIVLIEYVGTSSNYDEVGAVGGLFSGTDDGNSALSQDGSTWTTYSTVDVIFYVYGSPVKSFTVDGVVKATNTKTFTTDGYVKQIQTQTFTADGIIKVTTTLTLGRSIQFNGLNQYLKVLDSTSLDITGNITVEARVLIPTNPDIYLSLCEFVKKNLQYILRLSSSATAQQLEAYIWVGGVQKHIIDPTPITSGQHDVALDYDGSTFRLYKDGAVVASVAATGAIDTSTNALTIGAQDGNGEDFKGVIDCIRVSDIARYKGAYTPATDQLTTDANTAMLLTLDDGYLNTSATTLTDSSGNGNDATYEGIVGPVWQPGMYPQQLTADGIIFATNTKTFTADGIVQQQFTKTFTTDGIVRVTTTKTFTADGVVDAPTTFTFTVDGIIKAINTKTFTVDGDVYDSNEKTFTVDGLISAKSYKSFTMDGYIANVFGTIGGYTLGGIQIKSPYEMSRVYLYQKTDFVMITGKNTRDLSSVKEEFTLKFKNLTKTQFDDIMTIVNKNKVVQFTASNNIDFNINTNVLVTTDGPEYGSLGNEYRSTLTLILTEEQ